MRQGLFPLMLYGRPNKIAIDPMEKSNACIKKEQCTQKPVLLHEREDRKDTNGVGVVS